MLDLFDTFYEIYVAKTLENSSVQTTEDRCKVIDKLYSCRPRSTGEWLFLLEVNNDYFLKKIHYIFDTKSLEGGSCDMSEILTPITKSKFSKFILTHNHPTPPVRPSIEDYVSTINLKKECAKIGKEIIDHIIWADHKYFSFLEKNLI